MDGLVPIGEAGRRLGLNPSALRYYEQRGLLRPAERWQGRRMYGPGELRRVAFIQTAQRIGMSLDRVAAFLHGPPHQWRDAVREQIRVLEARVHEAESALNFLGHALECPSAHPVDECPHLGAILDRRLAIGGQRVAEPTREDEDAS